MFLRLLSASAHLLTDCRLPIIKNFLIRAFIFLYKPNLEEALYRQPNDYSTFNEFFARPLKEGARPLAKTTLVSPADGQLVAAGSIKNGQLPTIKGRSYSLSALLGLNQHNKTSSRLGEKFKSGSWGLLYLSPKDYHRVHCPCNSKLKSIDFIPGRLLPVNNFVARRTPLLYAENQRAVFSFDTDQGGLLLIMVAALFVSSIETTWSGRRYALAPSKSWKLDVSLAKGDELGRFLMGSSVILITEKQTSVLAACNQPIQIGQPFIHL